MRLVLAALLLAVGAPASAQTQTVLFPGETGETLLASIRASYRPASVLSYSGAQDRLMDTVDRTTVGGQEGVVGVYTGYFVPLDGMCTYNGTVQPCRTGDANQDVFNGDTDINVEHTWPRSLLSGPAESDMHHLFPTQIRVNADRGNDRFAEIPDAQATQWYRGPPPYTQTSIPTADIDEYSEIIRGTSFEPREDHKGNVARALFYLRAVYDVQTNGDFPFDATDRRTLYAWHHADPITEADQARSARVAAFQSGKDNPFVLDSTLVRRAYFPEIVGTDAEVAPDGLALRLDGPNPFRAEARFALTLPEASPVRAEAFDALGRRVAVLHDGPAPAGALALRLGGERLAPGVYVVRVWAGGRSLTQRAVRAR